MSHPNQFPQGQPQYQQPGPPQQAYYQTDFSLAPQPQRGPAPKVETPSALGSLFSGFGRGVRGLLSVPLAFFGGIFGSLVLSASIVFVFWYLEQTAEASPAAEEDEFELEFQPGALTKLGVEPKPDEIPVKPINEETRTPDDVAKEAVTEDEKPPETPEEKKEIPEKAKDDKPVNKNKDAKISDKNRTDNNPYSNDLPNNIDPTGDPFGDPNGWSDMKKDGDPWATSVMMALNNMKVPGYAGKVGTGTYQFKLKICKDGTVDQVLQKGSSGNTDLDSRVKAELERLKIQKPPANIASKMKSNCVTLAYTFSWSSGKVK
jgi:outer membrane biosynthesis protein TonB